MWWTAGRFLIAPDVQFLIKGCYDRSPNVVVEVNYLGNNITDFVRKGMDYMHHTNNVLSVILIDITRFDTVPKTVSLVICEIRRILPPQQGMAAPVYAVAAANPSVGVLFEFRSLVSLGNVTVHADHRTEWLDSVYNTLNFQGVGFNRPVPPGGPYPPYNARNLPDYMYTIPAHIVPALNNLGLQLFHAVGGVVQNYQIDLYGIQENVLEEDD